jgi:hypothetical protein
VKWCGTTFLLATLPGCGTYGNSTQPEEEHSDYGEAHIAVRTKQARPGDRKETVEGIGRCEVLPKHIAMLKSAVEDMSINCSGYQFRFPLSELGYIEPHVAKELGRGGRADH